MRKPLQAKAASKVPGDDLSVGPVGQQAEGDGVGRILDGVNAGQ
jgi:hypothetical protein